MVGETNLINNVESTTLKLNDVALLQGADTTLSNGGVLVSGVSVNQLLDIVSFINLLFVDQMSVFNECDLASCVGVSTEPGDFLGLLEILVSLVNSSIEGDLVTFHDFLSDGGVTPLHQSKLFTLSDLSSVFFLDEKFTPVNCSLGANISVLGMEGLGAALNWVGTIFDNNLRCVVFVDTNIARGDGVNDFLVDGPDLVPLMKVVILGGALLQHEFLQCLDSHSLAHDALHGGETGIIPSLDVLLVDEPVQLTLGEDGRRHTQLREIINFDWAQFQNFLNPIVERIPVTVLNGTEGVCNTFKRVDNRDSQIVGGVGFVLGSGTVMGGVLASIEDGVTEATNFVLHVQLGSDAEV